MLIHETAEINFHPSEKGQCLSCQYLVKVCTQSFQLMMLLCLCVTVTKN